MIPTLLVGTGEQGRQVVRRARQSLAEEFPELLPAVRTVGLHAPVRVQMTEEGAVVPEPASTSTMAGEDLLFPCEGAAAPQSVLSCRNAFRETFTAHREEFLGRFADLGEALLSTQNLQQVRGVDGNACDVVLVAALQEPLGAALLFPVAQGMEQRLAEAHPGLRLRLEAVVLLPEGRCEEGALLATTLEEYARQSAAEDFPLHTLYFVSPANESGLRLSREALWNLCARFLVVRTASDLAARLRRPELDFGPQGRLGSIGLAVLEFPAESLIRSQTRRQTRAFVEGTLLRPDPQVESAKKRAADFTARQSLTPDQVEELREKLLIYETPRGPRRLDDELTIGAFLFSEVPPHRWHIALATFEAFFRREHLGRVLRWADENAERLRETLTGALREEVDRQVENSRDPDNALAFLAEVNRLLDELRKRLFTVAEVKQEKPAEPAKGPGLEAKLQQLRQAVANIPRWPPILLKALLLTLLLAVPVQVGLNNAAQNYGPWFGWLTVPLQWLAALLLPALPVFLAGWWTIQRATARARSVAEECVRLIENACKSQLYERVRVRLLEILDGLFLLTLDTASLHRDYPQYEGDSECREVERLKEHLRALPAVLAEEEAEEVEAWRINALSLAAQPLTFDYRQDPRFQDWEGECRRLLEVGFLRGWRQTTPQELGQKVLDFLREGFTYIRRIHLAQFLQERVWQGSPHLPQQMTDLYRRLHDLSQPLVLLDPNRAEGFSVVVFPAMESPETHAIRQQMRSVGSLQAVMERAIPYEQAHQFVLLQIGHHVPVEALRAFPIWQRALAEEEEAPSDSAPAPQPGEPPSDEGEPREGGEPT